MNHDQAVTEHYLKSQNSLKNSYWDEVFREKSYFENQTEPHRQPTEDKGNEVGEFDILLINREDRTALYKEIKTGYKDLGYAEDQLERADDHFKDWDIIGQKVLEK